VKSEYPPARNKAMRRGLMLLAVAVFGGAAPAAAQPADSHSEHHPGQTPSAPSAGQPAPSSAGGMEMMGTMMGGPPRKQLYPQLMELPVMTPEARLKIETDARARIVAGNAALVQGQDDYHRAAMNNDAAAMSAALSRQRAALAEIESGTSALRALAEGSPPHEIALSWFRDQMNLARPTSPVQEEVGPLNLSWFHIVSMTVVLLFALTMLVVGVGRRHRSLALVNRLTRPAGPQPAQGRAPVPISASPTPTTPAVSPPPPPSTKVQQSPPLPSPPTSISTWSGTLRVASIVRETPLVKTFRLVEPGGGAIPFSYAPGQFLTFSAQIDGRLVRRSYTIASPPTRTSYVEVTVKREEEGAYSRFLHDSVVPGSVLQLRGPSGVFTFDGGNAESIVLIAGGVGITPMMCVIRYLTDMSWPGEIFLILAARNTDELIFREELEYLQCRHPKLHVVASVGARSEGSAWMGLEGQITKDALAHAVPSLESRRVHLCGPPPMMEAIRRILSELGVPANQVKTEAFGPATGAVPPPRPLPPPPPPLMVTELVERVEAATPPLMESIPVAGPATATISFDRSHKSAPLPPDKTVLEVAESIGVPIDYSCRVGTCGLCKTKLLAGQVAMEVQNALTDDDKASGIILACQAHSLGDITVDA